MKNIIIASTSTLHGSGYLDYLLEELSWFFKSADTILFIPYARPSGISHDEYTAKVAEAFAKIGKSLKGIHQYENAVEAIKKAKGIFVGGGNTFVLVNQLYKNNLIDCIKKVATILIFLKNKRSIFLDIRKAFDREQNICPVCIHHKSFTGIP